MVTNILPPELSNLLAELRQIALEARQTDPAFWTDQDAARATVREIKTLTGVIGPMGQLLTRITDSRGMLELLAAEPDEAMS